MYLVKDVLTFHHMRENKTELFWPTKDQYCIHGTSHLQSIFRLFTLSILCFNVVIMKRKLRNLFNIFFQSIFLLTPLFYNFGKCSNIKIFITSSYQFFPNYKILLFVILICLPDFSIFSLYVLLWYIFFILIKL